MAIFDQARSLGTLIATVVFLPLFSWCSLSAALCNLRCLWCLLNLLWGCLAPFSGTWVMLLQLTWLKPLGMMAPSISKHFAFIFPNTLHLYSWRCHLPQQSNQQFGCLGHLSTSSPWGAGAQGHRSIAKQELQEVQRDQGRCWNVMTNRSY